MGATTGGVRTTLHFEGAALALLAFVLVWPALPGVWLCLLIFMLPDVSMLGYLLNKRLGAAIYNVAHSTIGPIVLLVYGYHSNPAGWVYVIGGLWLAHIGVDRVFGYGLKYPSSFAHTHLSWRE